MNDVISYALQRKRIDFDETKKQYFNKKRKVKIGKMKFKSKHSNRDSFRIPGQALGFSACVNFDLGTIKLPKMSPMKLVIDRKFTGTLKSVTVSRNPSNQYFVSVLVEEEMGGTTYSIQYTTDSKETLQKYYDEDAPRLRDEGFRLFGEKMLAFRTELELISEH